MKLKPRILARPDVVHAICIILALWFGFATRTPPADVESADSTREAPSSDATSSDARDAKPDATAEDDEVAATPTPHT